MLRVLGKGAMGVVYEGRDPNLDRRVAIKTIMVDDLGPDAAAEYEARFRIEARSAARLQHPNIVTVYDSDRHGDTAFLVMEFIQGEDLKHHLDRGLKPTPEQALQLTCDLLAALDFAHRQGVVHRDIKPANLLIEADGRVKLTDFGVARISGEATRTQGSMIGTLKYMAPEQVQGLKVDTRADLFSAGVVAYQLLTGVRPFEGDNDFTIIHQIIGQAPALPSSIQPALPPGADEVLLRGLAKNRDERYQTAGEFSAALQAAFGIAVVGLATQPGRTLPGLHTTTAPIAPLPSLPGGINQELELEYWRSVRDTVDTKELEGFLARFPQGIYADLARRRLLRLGAEPDPDLTMLQGTTRPPGGTLTGSPTAPVASAAQDDELTRDPTVPFTRGTVPPAVAVPAPTPTAPTAAPSPVPATPALGAATPAPAARRAPEPTVPLVARRKVPMAAIAGVGLATVVVAAGWFALRPGAATPVAGAPSQDSIVAAAPASAQPAPGASVAVAAASAGTSRPALTASAALAAASAARPAASASARKASASSQPAGQKPTVPAAAGAPASAASAARTEPVVAQREEKPTATAAAARLASPMETCKDRTFLAKPLCLHTECGKPEYGAYPFCVRLREEQRQHQVEAERAQQTR
nr:MULTISPECIES: serine/threonine-protein kinase [Ramlibacter]